MEHDPFIDGLPISKKVIAIAMFSLAEDIYVLVCKIGHGQGKILRICVKSMSVARSSHA